MKNLVTLVLLAMICAPLHGETITVCQDGSCEHTDIQPALDAANDGDVIVVGPGIYTGLYTLLGYDGDASHLIIRSSDGPENTILDAEHAGVVFWMAWSDDQASGVSVEIDGFTLRRGTTATPMYARGAAIDFRPDQYEENAELRIANCIFEECTFASPQYDDDALIFHSYLDDLIVEDCVFTGGNHQWLYLRGSSTSNTFTVRNCTFAYNTGAYIVRRGCVVDCTFRNNDADTLTADNWEVTGCIFEDNIVDNGCVNGALGYIRNSTFLRNSSSTSSAAIYSRGAPEIEDCIFRDNTGIYGGAISNYYSSNTNLPLQVVGCTFENNSATFGGAIWAQPSIRVYVYDSVGCGNLPTDFYGPVTDAGGNDFAETCCPADLNGDGNVDGGDLATVLANWGGDFIPADLDHDGQIGGSDLTIVLGLWGSCNG